MKVVYDWYCMNEFSLSYVICISDIKTLTTSAIVSEWDYPKERDLRAAVTSLKARPWPCVTDFYRLSGPDA